MTIQIIQESYNYSLSLTILYHFILMPNFYLEAADMTFLMEIVTRLLCFCFYVLCFALFG